MQNPKRILFTGGGSGGHIIPNLALIEELKALLASELCPPFQLFYIGSRQPLDRALIQSASGGIPFRAIFTGKLRRYFSWRHFVDPFLFLIGFLQSCYHIARFWPQVVFSKGGHVGLPVALAAWIFRRPLMLHESDAVMGLANKMAARLATTVCLGFPIIQETGPRTPEKQKTVVTGNPTRSSILHGSKERGYALTGFTPEKPVMLVWGGSQGAQEINDLVRMNFEILKLEVQIVHITGAGKSIGIQDIAYKAFEYLGDELADIYAITDVVVGRGGANSLYELALMQKPNILLPLKGAASGHQEQNARFFAERGASLVLENSTQFVATLTSLLNDSTKQKTMKEALATLARPSAANTIVRLLLAL